MSCRQQRVTCVHAQGPCWCTGDHSKHTCSPASSDWAQESLCNVLGMSQLINPSQHCWSPQASHSAHMPQMLQIGVVWWRDRLGGSAGSRSVEPNSSSSFQCWGLKATQIGQSGACGKFGRNGKARGWRRTRRLSCTSAFTLPLIATGHRGRKVKGCRDMFAVEIL